MHIAIAKELKSINVYVNENVAKMESFSVLNKNRKSVRHPKGSDMECFMTCSGTGFVKIFLQN